MHNLGQILIQRNFQKLSRNLLIVWIMLGVAPCPAFASGLCSGQNHHIGWWVSSLTGVVGTVDRSGVSTPFYSDEKVFHTDSVMTLNGPVKLLTIERVLIDVHIGQRLIATKHCAIPFFSWALGIFDQLFRKQPPVYSTPGSSSVSLNGFARPLRPRTIRSHRKTL